MPYTFNPFTGNLDYYSTASGGTTNNFNTLSYAQKNLTGSGLSALTGSVNGSNTAFTVPGGVYITGTLEVYLNGILQVPGDAITETTPASGIFDFVTAPVTNDQIYVVYQSLTTTSSNFVTIDTNQTITGIKTFSPTARTTAAASYLTINAPADTGITASTESKGINIVGGTRTWADGTVGTQRENFIGKPTYNKTTTSATFTTAATLYIEGSPVAGTGVTITSGYSAFIDGNNTRIGATAVKTLNSDVGGIGLEIGGSNNTAGGMNLSLSNASNGTSAFTSLFLQNDISDNVGAHYGNIGLNSSTYSDTTFGTGIAIPNQLGITNTDGPITIGSFKASTGAVTFLAGGAATTNEVGRFTVAGLTVGLTGTLTGAIKFAGATSTQITLQGQAVGASGVLTLPAVTDTLVAKATTDTLTNKRITKRVVTVTQSATPTINTDNTDVAYITGLAQAVTSFTTNLSGTPVNGDVLIIDITDSGTGRALTFGTSFEASTIALPTTTVASTKLTIGFRWNTVTSKWTCVAVA